MLERCYKRNVFIHCFWKILWRKTPENTCQHLKVLATADLCFCDCGFLRQAHNRNLLSIDFDRTTRLGKIYDDHRKFTLRILYDQRGRPIVWSPSSKYNEVRVTYSLEGLVTSIHRGNWTERREYEHGRMIARTWASGKTWNYSFLDKVILKYIYIYFLQCFFNKCHPEGTLVKTLLSCFPMPATRRNVYILEWPMTVDHNCTLFLWHNLKSIIHLRAKYTTEVVVAPLLNINSHIISLTN